MRALILMDSYKGCLSSGEAALAASHSFDKDDPVAVMEVSDGGEGFAQILSAHLGATKVLVPSHDPLGEPMLSSYYITPDGLTAILDTASASGLLLVPPERRNLLHSNTFGTGELLSAALDEGVERVLIGLGGSATCDCGLGLLQALGFRLLSPDGHLVGNPVIAHIASIDGSHSHRNLRNVRIEAFYDGDIPFCGKGGAALEFTAQKGAGPALAETLDTWMWEISRLYSLYCGEEVRHSKGAGAAGGLGGALHAVLHARMNHGISRFLEVCAIDDILEEMVESGEQCIVVTGEGRSDSQTLMGKVPLGVLDYIRKSPITSGYYANGRMKVVLCSGAIENPSAFIEEGFSSAIQVTPPSTPKEDILDGELAKANIERALREALTALRQRC